MYGLAIDAFIIELLACEHCLPCTEHVIKSPAGIAVLFLFKLCMHQCAILVNMNLHMLQQAETRKASVRQTLEPVIFFVHVSMSHRYPFYPSKSEV